MITWVEDDGDVMVVEVFEVESDSISAPILAKVGEVVQCDGKWTVNVAGMEQEIQAPDGDAIGFVNTLYGVTTSVDDGFDDEQPMVVFKTPFQNFTIWRE